MSGEQNPGSPAAGAAPARPSGQPRAFTLRERHRLRKPTEFKAVFDAKLRKGRGPITVFALPRAGEEPRLGISIGRKYGPAHERNRLKRMVRESFRLSRLDLPRPEFGGEAGAYDLVVIARPHEHRPQGDYERWFREAVWAIHRELGRRGRRDERRGDGPGTGGIKAGDRSGAERAKRESA